MMRILLILALLLAACSNVEIIDLKVVQQVGQQIELLNITEQEPVDLNLTPEFMITREFGTRNPPSINGTIKNVGNRTGSVNLTAKVFYTGVIVSAKTVTIEDVKIDEEIGFAIPFGREIIWDGYVLIMDIIR